MNQGDQQGVHLEESILDNLDIEDAFESFKIITGTNSNNREQQSIGSINMRFDWEIFFKELIQNMTQPLCLPQSWIYEGCVGTENRKLGLDNIHSWINMIVWQINIAYFTSCNQELQWGDLIFFDVMQVIQKLVVAIKYGFYNQNEYAELNKRVFSNDVLKDNQLAEWINPRDKFLHLLCLKAEFKCGINMSKTIDVTYNKDQNECDLKEEQLEIIKKVANCNYRDSVLSLRTIVHLIVFKSQSSYKVFYHKLIMQSLIYTYLPMMLRQMQSTLPSSNYWEIAAFWLLKTFQFVYFLTNLIQLSSSIVDIDRKNIWIRNLIQCSTPQGQQDVGIKIPLTKPNNLLSFLSLLTQFRLVGMQFYNRSQSFQKIQLFCIASKIVQCVIKIIKAYILNQHLVYEQYQLLIESVLESVIISLQIVQVLKYVGYLNDNQNQAQALINRNKLFIQQELQRLKFCESKEQGISQEDFINGGKEKLKFRKSYIEIEDIINANSLNSLKKRMFDKHGNEYCEVNFNISNDDSKKDTIDDKTNEQQQHTDDSAIFDSNDLEINIKAVESVNVRKTNLVNFKSEKQENKDEKINDLETAQEMSSNLTQVIETEAEKYPFTILGMHNEQFFISSMLSVAGTIVTLYITILFTPN